MKERIIKMLLSALKKEGIKADKDKIEKFLEVPPKPEMGDFAFPCFAFAKEMKTSPQEIALRLRGHIGSVSNLEFDDIRTQGPYINFFVNRKDLARKIIQEVAQDEHNYGKGGLGKKDKIVIEFPSPNTNKPLHLGHLRNMAIGESVSRILEKQRAKLIRANLNNDRGVHICKSMLAYQKWGEDRKPTKRLKSDHLVGEFYVLFNEKLKKNKKLDEQAQAMLKLWEEGDEKTIELWKKMNKWALDGFKETFETFGITHDKEYFESEIYKEGKNIIMEGVKKKVFTQDKDGAVYIDLEDIGLGKKYLLRADGTAIYITQDIYLAKLKYEEFKANKSIYVVGNEQEYHFQVLFEILDRLKLLPKENSFHLSYGMVNLPEGRMKSREGTVVDADTLIEQTAKLVKKELKAREDLDKDELEERSLKIALAAIKYMLLKIDSKKNMVFNPKESISFEGDTGPYLLYSYARAKSILTKVKKESRPVTDEELEEKETQLVVKMNQFKEIAEEAYTHLNPALIANYAYGLAQTFNEFYHACPVIGSSKKEFRLALVETFAQILKNALELLGIEVLERM